MSFKLTPITARIQKTTKGGIVQPILNMGDGLLTKRKEGAVGKLKVSEEILNKNRAKNKSSDSSVSHEPRKNSRQEIASRKRKNAVTTGGIGIDYGLSGGVDWKKPVKKAKKSTSEYKPGEGVLKNTPKSTAGNFEPANPSNANPVPWDFRQDKKIEGGSHSGVKGKMGSEKRRKEYDAKGWAYDETIAKPKPKSVKTPKAKGVVGTAKPKLSTKLASSKAVEPKKQQPAKKAVEKAGKKLDSADRKDSRAARVRQKGIDALASGNTKKANRLKRRETRIKNRADKKRGQASKAIDPNN